MYALSFTKRHPLRGVSTSRVYCFGFHTFLAYLFWTLMAIVAPLTSRQETRLLHEHVKDFCSFLSLSSAPYSISQSYNNGMARYVQIPLTVCFSPETYILKKLLSLIHP